MTAKKKKITVVVKSPKIRNWFEKNQGLIQFVLVLISLLALAFTVYFSNKSIDISATQLTQGNEQIKQGRQQLKQAEKQLKLAQEQFIESQRQQKKATKEKILEEAINQERFNVQKEINKKNLIAIELQAKIAQKQYEAQLNAAKEQAYLDRPIFVLSAVKYDSVKNLGCFTIKNIGKRSVKIMSSNIFDYNESNNRINKNIVKSDFSELNEKSFTIFYLPMAKSDFSDEKTLYYIQFTFEDIVNKGTDNFAKCFKWKSTDKENVVWSELIESERKKMQLIGKNLNIIK